MSDESQGVPDFLDSDFEFMAEYYWVYFHQD